MAQKKFDRDKMAQWYAKRHLQTDPGTVVVYYLPGGAPEQEIRLLEINELIAPRDLAPLEPIDFGVEVGRTAKHRLMVLDVTPAQWERINKKELRLPKGWSLDGAIDFPR